MQKALTIPPENRAPVADDHELLRRYVQASDESAFRDLVRRHEGMVESAAKRVLRNQDLVHEVSQNVFALLARKAPHLPHKVTISGWLFKAARFEALRLGRNDATRHRHLRAYAIDSDSPDVPEGLQDAFRESLDEALMRLGDRDREAILLRFYEEMPYRELGARLGKSEAAAQKQVERSLEKLRVCLRRKGFDRNATGMMASVLGAQLGSVAEGRSLPMKFLSGCEHSIQSPSRALRWPPITIMSTHPSITLGLALALTLTVIVIWQSADLRASQRAIRELEQTAFQQEGVSAMLKDAQLAEIQDSPPAREEMPPIVVPATPTEAMQMFVRYKMREFASHQRFGNKVLPPGSAERNAFEQEKQQLLVEMSSLMVAQPMLNAAWKGKDTDLAVQLYVAGFAEVFGESHEALTPLQAIFREALEAKRISRERFPQGTPEAVEAERALQDELLEEVGEILSPREVDLFLGVFGRQPITNVSFGLPLVYDSEEERLADPRGGWEK